MSILDTMREAVCNELLDEISGAIVREFERWNKAERVKDWNDEIRVWISQKTLIHNGRLPAGFEQEMTNVIEPVIKELIK